MSSLLYSSEFISKIYPVYRHRDKSSLRYLQLEIRPLTSYSEFEEEKSFDQNIDYPDYKVSSDNSKIERADNYIKNARTRLKKNTPKSKSKLQGSFQNIIQEENNNEIVENEENVNQTIPSLPELPLSRNEMFNEYTSENKHVFPSFAPSSFNRISASRRFEAGNYLGNEFNKSDKLSKPTGVVLKVKTALMLTKILAKEALLEEDQQYSTPLLEKSAIHLDTLLEMKKRQDEDERRRKASNKQKQHIMGATSEYLKSSTLKHSLSASDIAPTPFDKLPLSYNSDIASCLRAAETVYYAALTSLDTKPQSPRIFALPEKISMAKPPIKETDFKEKNLKSPTFRPSSVLNPKFSKRDLIDRLVLTRPQFMNSFRLQEIIQKYWLFLVNSDKKLTKGKYVWFHTLLYCVLFPLKSKPSQLEQRRRYDRLRTSIDKDWLIDSEFNNFMDEGQFFLSMFELAESWCGDAAFTDNPDTDLCENVYADFLTTLFAQVIKIASASVLDGENEDVYCDTVIADNDEQLLVKGKSSSNGNNINLENSDLLKMSLSTSGLIKTPRIKSSAPSKVKSRNVNRSSSTTNLEQALKLRNFLDYGLSNNYFDDSSERRKNSAGTELLESLMSDSETDCVSSHETKINDFSFSDFSFNLDSTRDSSKFPKSLSSSLLLPNHIPYESVPVVSMHFSDEIPPVSPTSFNINSFKAMNSGTVVSKREKINSTFPNPVVEFKKNGMSGSDLMSSLHINSLYCQSQVTDADFSKEKADYVSKSPVSKFKPLLCNLTSPLKESPKKNYTPMQIWEEGGTFHYERSISPVRIISKESPVKKNRNNTNISNTRNRNDSKQEHCSTFHELKYKSSEFIPVTLPINLALPLRKSSSGNNSRPSSNKSTALIKPRELQRQISKSAMVTANI